MKNNSTLLRIAQQHKVKNPSMCEALHIGAKRIKNSIPLNALSVYHERVARE